MATQSQLLVTVENLAIDFDHRARPRSRRCSGVSFSLTPGEVLGIVGESGSGKTVACRSILKLLAGQCPHRSGRILFEGRDMLAHGRDANSAAPRRARRHDLPESFDPSRSAHDRRPPGRRGPAGPSTASPARRRAGTSIAPAGRTCASPSPSAASTAYPHQLSGGMRQRVMIAAALACRPKLADRRRADHRARRHRAGADPRSAAPHPRGARASPSSWSPTTSASIAQMCDRVVVMKDGTVVETGAVDDIIERAAQDYTKRLIASQPALLTPAVPSATPQGGQHPGARQAQRQFLAGARPAAGLCASRRTS